MSVTLGPLFPWSNSYNFPKELKICFIGDPEVGKDSLFKRFVVNEDTQPPNTCGHPGNWARKAMIDGQEVPLLLSATCGQERFRALGKSYFRGAAIVLLVFDVTNQASFDNLPSWLGDLKTSAPSASVYLIGNKIDCSPRVVESSTAQRFADENGIPLYCETCAKSLESTEAAFVKVLSNYAANHPGIW